MSVFYRTRYKTYNKIAELRKEKGLSQTQLAEIVGLSRNALSSIERFEAEPTYRTAYVISLYFEKPIYEIFLCLKIK